MQTLDDDFPYTSEDPSLSPHEEKGISPAPAPQSTDDIKAALRLVIGSALNGSDVFTERLRRMKATQETVTSQTIKINENETSQEQLRYLLLGILFATPEAIERRLKSVDRGSSKVFNFISKLVSPITDSWILSPVKDQYDYAVARGEKIIDRLIMKGRVEEQNSRLMLQQKAVDDLINEFAEYLVLKIKVQEIIEREGTSMAGDVIGEFQEQSSGVDALLEGKLKSILRKSTPPDNPTVPSEKG